MPHVYYARIVANVLGFLRLVRQITEQRKLDPDTLSFGLGLRGIKGTTLECITRGLMRGFAGNTPPDRDTFLALRSADDGPWQPDSVAMEFSEALLNHWEFTRPGWMADTPEFKAGAYDGDFFRENFQQW
jgi:hypothetical protein